MSIPAISPTNIQAGAHYGYGLLWVVLLANILAMLFQAMSAKLGIVTGQNLAQLCRSQFPRPVVLAMWVISEIAAMATDLAEFLGGAIGLSLLFGLPLLAGMGITAIATYAILMLDRRGYRPLELAIGAMVGDHRGSRIIGGIIHRAAGIGARRRCEARVVPHLADSGAVTLAVGIVGATVMPHAIYLHSGLTQARGGARNDAGRRHADPVLQHRGDWSR